MEAKLGKWVVSHRLIRNSSSDMGKNSRNETNKSGRKTEKTMCGRYYVDDETAGEIKRLVERLDERLRRKPDQSSSHGSAAGIAAVFPSQNGIVIMGRDRHLDMGRMIWGFPRFDGKGLLINARAETAVERRSFRECVLHRRCVVPAKGFWEWNKSKEKFSFERPDSRIMFMAGCYDCFEGQDRFVILTTEANASVRPVHDRMPLILEQSEIEDWVMDNGVTEHFLRKTPILLEKGAEYEQMSLF